MSYPGGKGGAGVYQRIINLMPPHERYFEPFLGNATVMRMKRPAALNIGVDLDPASPGLVWVATRNTPVLSELYAHHASGRALKRLVRARDRDRRRRLSQEAASRIAAADFRIPSPDPASVDRPSLFSARSADGIEFLSRYKFTATDLVYCDPPYLMETRSSGRKLYRCEMSTLDHRRLLRVIRDLPCMVMISGYWAELYAKALKEWRTVQFETMTRGGRPATEWLWLNFPWPDALHDYRYLGENFRERERIGRKKRRWTERLRRMPRLERQALLAAIALTAGSGEATRL